MFWDGGETFPCSLILSQQERRKLHYKGELSIFDTSGGDKECKGEVFMNDWSREGCPLLITAKYRGILKHTHTHTRTISCSKAGEFFQTVLARLRWTTGWTLPRIFSSLSPSLSAHWSAFWPSRAPACRNIEWMWGARMENWVRPEFLIHRSIRDQCVQVGDLTEVITEEQVALPHRPPLEP